MFTHALRKNACFLGANIGAEMEPITRTALSFGRPASCILSEMQLPLKGRRHAAGGVQEPGGSHSCVKAIKRWSLTLTSMLSDSAIFLLRSMQRDECLIPIGAGEICAHT